MTDLHPERLLHASSTRREGTLNPRLHQHLADCELCRLEVAIRRGAAEERRDDPSSAALETSLRRAMSALVAEPPPRSSRARPPLVRPRRAGAIAIGIAVGGIILLAMLLPGLRGDAQLVVPGAESQALHGSSSARDSGRVRPAVVTANAAALRSVPRPVPPPVDASGPSAPVEDKSLAGAIGRREPTAETPKASTAAVSARELFDQATAAVKAGHVDEALGLFEALSRQHPDSREAATGTAICGRIWLERKRDYARALAEFSRYLESGHSTTLAPEVLAGKARALRGLGRTQEAQAVWRELARLHPQSTPGRRALEQIGEQR